MNCKLSVLLAEGKIETCTAAKVRIRLEGSY